MPTYAYSQVLVWDHLGGSVRVARNQRVTVTDPATGATAPGLKQGGVAVAWVTTDADGHADFEATIPTVDLITLRGFQREVISADAMAEAMASGAIAQQAAAAAAASAALVGAPSKAAMDAAMGGDVAGLVGKVGSVLTSPGSGDNTAALNAFFALPAPLGIRKLTGTFTASANLTLPAGYLDLTAATINFSHSSGDCLTLAGTYAAPVTLTASLIEGSKTLAIPTAGFAAGDMLLITSAAVFDSGRTGAKYGELNEVLSVDSASQVTLKMESQAGYLTTDSAVARKVTPVERTTIVGGRFTGTNPANTLRGLNAQYARNLTVSGARFEGINRVQAQLCNVAGAVVTGCTFRVAKHASQGYGLSVMDATQDVVIANNLFREVRHSVSTNNDLGGTSGGVGGGIVRRILAIGNDIIDSEPATGGTGGDALDTHAGSERIYYINNVIHSASGHGINFEARSGVVSGNTVSNTANVGIYITPRSDLPGWITCNGNSVRNTGPGATDYGISINTTSATLDSVVVTGNSVSRCSGTGLRVTGTATYPISRATITGNTVDTSSNTGMQPQFLAQSTISGNTVRSALFGINASGTGLTIASNTVECTATSGATMWLLRLDGTRCSVTGNVLRYTATGVTTIQGVSFASTTTYSGVWNNVTEGCTSVAAIGSGTGNVQANNI